MPKLTCAAGDPQAVLGVKGMRFGRGLAGPHPEDVRGLAGFQARGGAGVAAVLAGLGIELLHELHNVEAGEGLQAGRRCAGGCE